MKVEIRDPASAYFGRSAQIIREEAACYLVGIDAGGAQITFTVRKDLVKQAFRSELTEVGEQLVIPGCERDEDTPVGGQLGLF
jgi:hypothetical protein